MAAAVADRGEPEGEGELPLSLDRPNIFCNRLNDPFLLTDFSFRTVSKASALTPRAACTSDQVWLSDGTSAPGVVGRDSK